MRNLLLSCILSLSLLSNTLGYSGESGLDRPGGDLPGMPVILPSPQSCQDLCTKTRGCLVWVFSNKTGGDKCTQSDLCWLKNQKTNLVQDSCKIVGVLNRKLNRLKYMPLPAGQVQASGWLLDQLKTQAVGLGGFLSEFWPFVANSTWIGGNVKDPGNWENEDERVPYWLNGCVPTAYLTGDQHLIQQVERYLNYIMDNQRKDGWMGMCCDAWSRMPLVMSLIQYAEMNPEKTPRVVDVIWKYLEVQRWYLFNGQPLKTWGQVRWQDLLLNIFWVYDNHPRGREEFLLNFADLVYQQGFDWADWFISPNYPKGPCSGSCTSYVTHGVNTGQALKSSAVWYRLSNDPKDLKSSYERVEILDRYHGQASGIFSCSEHVAGLDPSQGSETCTVVEAMYSYEWIFAQTGDVAHADRVESLAFNALPGSMTADTWAHVYLQQSNNIYSGHVDPHVYISDGPDSNIYGLEPNYGCCTANFVQGWPKFTQHLFMSTADGGLIASTYSPSVLKTTVKGGSVTIKEETNYPWEETIKFTIQSQVDFPFYFRIPSWADSATYQVGKGPKIPAKSGIASIKISAGSTTVLTLNFPMKFRIANRLNGAVSVYRGPFLYALTIGEKYQQLRKYAFKSADYSVSPTSPWQYGLSVDTKNLENSFRYSYKGFVGKAPFSYNSSPVSVAAQARRIEWGLDRGAAAPPPMGPIYSGAPLENVTLVPYGATRLRMAEVPILKK